MKKLLFGFALLLGLSLVWLGFDNGSKKKVKVSEDYSWLKEGDILFQDMGGDFGEAIKLATKSKFSHCGMVMKMGGEMMVYEAVGPVKFTSLKEWISHGINKSFTVKRLIDQKKLTTEVTDGWKKQARSYSGKAYDHVFGWSDDKIYCSELVWKMYKNGMGTELSSPKKLKDFDLSHALVKQQLALRYGSNIPYEENVVSPQDLFDSKLLEEVKK
ncbi:MAG: YiiX family permuted papain-like enzyme [Bacteroidetes bacterium]|jgi:uncharacterized protein YycO|nr:YiiX family permuted papain-like enzyme [Bacteroidota bacterium]